MEPEPKFADLLREADQWGNDNNLILGLAGAVRYLLGCRNELRNTNRMLADALVVGTRQHAVTQAMPWTEEANARRNPPPYYGEAVELERTCLGAAGGVGTDHGTAASGEVRLDGLADAVAEVGRDWLEQGELPLVPRRENGNVGFHLVDRGGRSLEVDEGYRYDDYRQEWVPR